MILILTQCFPPVIGGVERLVGGMAAALAAAGERVEVHADGRSGAADAAAPHAVLRFGGLKFLRRRRKARFAARRIAGGDVSRVFCDSWKSIDLLPKPPPGDCHVVVLAHGTEYPLFPSPRKRRRIAAALAKADRVLAVSAATRDRMRQCGAPTDKVEIWHPPIDAPKIPSAEARAAAAALWAGKSPKLLTVGRLTERKGIDVAIRAAAELRAAHPNLRHVVAGDGSQAAALRELSARCGMGDVVHFVGAATDEEKSALYESADVFVLPARPAGDDMEGFGIVFLEAAYWGLPAVAGRFGGAAEAVEDGVTGLHCDGADVADTRRALAEILADSGLRRRLGENAKRKAEGFLWSARAGELLR